MSDALRGKIVAIGNSRGVRLPKTWLTQLQMEDEVEMTVKGDGVFIRPTARPRADWAAKFQKAASPSGPEPTLSGPNEFDHGEWTW